MPETETLRPVLLWMSFPFLVIGCIANLLVIRIAHETRAMQTPTNCLLVNMAFSDGITILLSFIFAFWFSKVACMFVFLTEMSIMVSAITITVVALDRYHAVKQPLRTGLRISQSVSQSLFKHGKIQQEFKNKNNLTILNKIQNLTTTNLTKTCFS